MTATAAGAFTGLSQMMKMSMTDIVGIERMKATNGSISLRAAENLFEITAAASASTNEIAKE